MAYPWLIYGVSATGLFMTRQVQDNYCIVCNRAAKFRLKTKVVYLENLSLRTKKINFEFPTK
ncbi:hypothetical protein AEQU2_01191 [Aequorivita lipolytica]|nr:hypothetical protein AEQU2_01191 [Aequorivita lipolytica]